MSPRKFNLICAVAVIAAVAITIALVSMSQGSLSSGGPSSIDQNTGAGIPDEMMIRPLSLGLSLAIVVDMGLMTAGLVILFMDDGLGRYRTR